MSASPPGSILIVDDDDAIRETLRVILEEEGYPVAAAANGREALLQLEAGPTLPSLCIVDLVMPVLNGWELCAELARRPTLAALPVLLVSANSSLDGPPPGLQTVHVMRKPLAFDRLLEHVERYCRR
jgi:CheY-like chemotaxis protein